MSDAKEKSGSGLLQAPTILKALAVLKISWFSWVRTFWTTNDYLLVTYKTKNPKNS